MGREKRWSALTPTRLGREERVATNAFHPDVGLLPHLQEAVMVEPVREGLEPPVGGVARVSHAEAVATVLIEVELDGLAGVEPRLDQAELALEEKVIGRDGDE